MRPGELPATGLLPRPLVLRAAGITLRRMSNDLPDQRPRLRLTQLSHGAG